MGFAQETLPLADSRSPTDTAALVAVQPTVEPQRTLQAAVAAGELLAMDIQAQQATSAAAAAAGVPHALAILQGLVERAAVPE